MIRSFSTKMLAAFVLLLAGFALSSAHAQKAIEDNKNTVIVLGMIHSEHRTSKHYSLENLKLIESIIHVQT